MDLTSNELFMSIKKKIIDKEIKNKTNLLPSISIRKKLAIMKKKEKEENYEQYFKGIILNESNISNFIYNSVNPKINICFNNLEYLSITNNYLINLDFATKLPDLFYLDVYGNPLDEFNSLNYKNTFGYLRLSVDKFHENKILSVSGLNCAILEVEIKDKSILKLFKINNPNIFMFNNEINYYIYKLTNGKRKSIRSRSRLNNYMPNSEHKNLDDIKRAKYLSINYFSSNNLNFGKDENESLSSSEMMSENSVQSNSNINIDDYYKNDNNNNSSLSKMKVEIKNSSLLEIKNFFEELNKILTKISKRINETITVSHLVNDNLYLNLEKKRLLLLYHTYLKLSVFNSEKKSGSFHSQNANSMNSNNFSDNIKIYEIKKYIKCININIRFGLIILTTMLFFSLNLISMKLSITIIHYLLLKFYKYDEHKQIPIFDSFGNFHYLCYYFDNLEDFKNKLKFAEKSQIDLYQKILNILEIRKLILMSNYLKLKKEENEKNKNQSLINDNSTKNKVSSLLLFMKELNMDKDIFILIEFFCDFIIYENMEQIVINGSFSDEYSTLIEIKEILEQIELDRNNLSIKDLSNKKYYKNKLERIFNKFYFENKKIKEIKNKNFKNISNNKMNPTKFNMLSFIFNWNKDYMKTDQINIKNCFSIDKLIKNKITNSENLKVDNNNNYAQNISEERRVFIQEPNSNYHTLQANKSSTYTLKNINGDFSYKDRSRMIKKTPEKLNSINNFNTINYEINNNISKINNIIPSEHRNNMYGVQSTVNIYNINKDQKNILENKNKNLIHKSNTYTEIFKYIDQKNKKNKLKLRNTYKKKFIKTLINNNIEENNLKSLKNMINYKEKKVNNYYNTIDNNGVHFPYGSINKKDAKIKIKKIDDDIASINAHKLFSKKRNRSFKQNIQIHNEIFSNDFFVEKYNQEKQAKIIRKIIANKNKEIQDKINEKKSKKK